MLCCIASVEKMCPSLFPCIYLCKIINKVKKYLWPVVTYAVHLFHVVLWGGGKVICVFSESFCFSPDSHIVNSENMVPLALVEGKRSDEKWLSELRARRTDRSTSFGQQFLGL